MYTNIELIKLYENGLSHKEIVEKLNNEHKETVTLNAIKQRIARYLKTLNDEEKGKIRHNHKENSKKILFGKIEKLYRKGCTHAEISAEVGLEVSTVRQYTNNYFKHLKGENIKNSKAELISEIASSYEAGFTTIEIGQDLGLSASLIKKYTLNLSESIKNEHEKNYKRRLDIRRENNRIFNQTSNKTMCTRQAVISNLQSYYTDKDGNLRFNIERGAIPCDLPEVFSVAARF